MIPYTECRHYLPCGGRCRDHGRQCRVYLRPRLGCSDFERKPASFPSSLKYTNTKTHK